MNAQQYQKFWESVNFGEQGNIEGLIWQKQNGAWVMLIADPSTMGWVIPCSVQYNPWTGERLSEKVAQSLDTEENL